MIMILQFRNWKEYNDNLSCKENLKLNLKLVFNPMTNSYSERLTKPVEGLFTLHLGTGSLLHISCPNNIV